MTALEKKAIREQKELGFWQQPRPLRVTIVTLCLAAVIQGWVQTGLVSPIISIFFQYEEARCFFELPSSQLLLRALTLDNDNPLLSSMVGSDSYLYASGPSISFGGFIPI
jgi:hypothetical protein